MQDDFVQNAYNSDEEKEKIISEKLMNNEPISKLASKKIAPNSKIVV